MFAAHYDPSEYHAIFDDFDDLSNVATTGRWQTVKGTGGTTALVAANVGGRVNIPTAASQNDYVLLASQQKIFQFAAKKPLWFECLIQCTEANTNQANIAVGLSSITTTGFMTTGNGGLPATWDGAVWSKTGGTLALAFTSSKGGTPITTTTPSLGVNGSATYASATDYRLGFHFDPNDGVTGLITPYYNGLPCLTTQATIYQQKITISGLGTLYPILAINAGSASAETLQVDYIRIIQKR